MSDRVVKQEHCLHMIVSLVNDERSSLLGSADDVALETAQATVRVVKAQDAVVVPVNVRRPAPSSRRRCASISSVRTLRLDRLRAM